jgi:arginyl-tRNA synthetase
MPAFLAPYLIALAVGFGSGFYVSHTLSASQLNALRLSIEQANSEAAASLLDAQHQAHQAQVKAMAASRQLDQSHEAFIETANALHRELATVRLSDTGSRQDCKDALPVARDPIQSETKAGHPELSASVDQFLKAEAYRADRLAAYADACYQFIATQGG